MSTINRSTMPSQLVEGIKINYGAAYKERPMAFVKFFDAETSQKELERYQEIGGFGLHQLKPEGMNTALAQTSEGPTTFLTNEAYALGYQITHEALQDNLYKDILRKATDLGFSSRATKETVVLDLLNRGFSTATEDLLANGQPLFSLTQPLSGTGGETNQNRPTIASSLSEASLTADVANIRKFKDPAGKRIDVNPRMLFVPVELEVKGWKLLKTELSVGNGNNDLNPMRQDGGAGFFPDGVMSSPYLSDPNAYFIRTNQRGLVAQTREEARLMEEPLIRQMAQQVISYQRFVPGAYDFRSAYGNPGQ